MGKDVYGDKVTKVTLSDRLEETPMIIVTTKYGYSANMERISRGQAFGTRSSNKASKILEINFRHPVIIAMKDAVADDSESEDTKDLAKLLFDTALLQSGFIIESDNIGSYASRVDRIVRQSLGVDADATLKNFQNSQMKTKMMMMMMKRMTKTTMTKMMMKKMTRMKKTNCKRLCKFSLFNLNSE